MSLSIWSVFLAGILSFLSPCVLPLVPPYLCYMSGLSVEDLQQSRKQNMLKILTQAMAFVLGFTTIFVILGASATSLGTLLNSYRHLFVVASGIIIILMGINFLGLLRINLFSREFRFYSNITKASLWSAYFMGLAFAFGWTPCIGPVLGSVLSLASQKQTLWQGASLLCIYSAGLGLPFLLAALFSKVFMAFLIKFTKHLGYVEKLIGILLIIVGVLFITGKMQSL